MTVKAQMQTGEQDSN